MDYKFIKDEFPNAWEEFSKWGNHVACLSRQKKGLLFKFFDEHDFFIEIIPYNVDDWSYSIYRPYPDDNFALVHSMDGYLKRDICEDAAFSKAFELLDRDLTRNK